MSYLYEQFPDLFLPDLYGYVHPGMIVQLMYLPFTLDSDLLCVVTDTVVKVEEINGTRIIHTRSARYDSLGLQSTANGDPFVGFSLVSWEHTAASIKILINEKRIDTLLGIDP